MNLAMFFFMSEKPLSDIKFILDVHLGKLAKSLRLFGFDAFCDTNYNDSEIIRFSLFDNRTILTRDKELLIRKDVINGYRILSQKPDEQLKEVLSKFDLKSRINPFTRCTECNGILETVPKEEIIHRLFPKTREFYHNFKKCTVCDRIYWDGSHYERMRLYIDSVIKDVN
jgi:uncharacterized protein with PIN domain